MTEIGVFVQDGSNSANQAGTAFAGMSGWSVVDSEGCPDSMTRYASTMDVLVAPFTENSLRECIPEHAVWIAYGTPECILQAFFLGAQDYLSAPWTATEAVARVRRALSATACHGETRNNEMGNVVVAEGRTVVLRPAETTVWALLRRHRGRIVERAAISAVLDQPRSGASGSRRVDMVVARLRRALGPDGRYIETVRGRGYRLRD